jgi:DNA-binding NarL/FixJ family response regulator
MAFRHVLGTSSGFQSAQFREIEFRLGLRDPRFLEHYEEGSAERQRLAAALAEPSLREAAQAALEALGRFDVTALLPNVKFPTLVLHRREIPWLPVDVARGLASRLPDARLSILEGESTAPYLGDTEAIAQAIDEFLSEGEPAPAEAEARPVDALGTASLRNAAGFTALTEKRSEARARAYPDTLTQREVEVLRLLASGRTNKEIADELVLSVRTVERHIGNIYGKIGARGRADATAYVLTRGLI